METNQPDRWALVVRGERYGEDAVLAEFDSRTDLWTYYRTLSESAQMVLWICGPDEETNDGGGRSNA